jgi:hypothetical protein
MDAGDQRRLAHAEAMLAKGTSALPHDLKNGYYWVWSAYMTKIGIFLKSDPQAAYEAIKALVSTTIDIHQRPNTTLHLEKQNEMVVLALFAREIAGARRLADLTTDPQHSHSFDVALNRLLRGVLRLATPPQDLGYKATAAEAGFFRDLECVAESVNTDFQGTDQYWSATKGKRYANTIFAQTNIFKAALQNAQGI